MGRHSRKGPPPKGPESDAAAKAVGGREGVRPEPGNGRRRRAADAPPGTDGHTPFQGVPQVRGGHPEPREPGGGWGAGTRQRYGDWQIPARADAGGQGRRPGAPRPAAPQQSTVQRSPMPQRPQPMSQQQATGERPLIPGPRREFVDAFDVPPASLTPPAPRSPSAPPADPFGPVVEWDERPPGEVVPGTAPDPKEGKGTKGRTFTGIAAAAVTTVLAVVVAGQVTHDGGGARVGAAAPTGVDRDSGHDISSRSDDRPTPEPAAVKALSYGEKMAKGYPLAPDLQGSGHFQVVPGEAKAPGRGHKYRYRIDVEKGLGLDAGLFAEAVQKTLNDDRSWAHDGAMTFERISSGDPDFVITLASPGTTGDWCKKSGLDTTEDNVSCDSAATERVMINAYRWAQGSSTFGPGKLFAYRQMLINHEVGHRLGHDHVTCRTPGALAPVMQQQTKSLDIDGIKCRPNPWVYPAR
ncbi:MULTISPECIES: DUF3152 domain-containing protein [unclassified Streptomyces]|uniref:DUF3152 domain-containing protein n=1 Tax=unclassified Streptomyces TaxID=2593676 RepID=UPI0029B6E033|nr:MULTISPECIES: DUF3152 domain-containing protein [unclassified Streptomyces]MDX3764713.1 DUF3152 domain-containing protein [Streptomyces sp. AK08-01B]MDX3814292.1 DUF3152 domain-containing protein [Streptomyces sp. AK08-01A]